MTLTVVKNNTEIVFDTVFVNLNEAKEYLAEYGDTANNFILSLLSKRKLSEKQEAWIHYLATEAKKEQESPETVEEGPYIELVEQMYAAPAKARKFTVRLPLITISTVLTGANVGCLYLYENKTYVGKITPQGQLIANVNEDVKNILLDANENLLELAKVYGHETGQCSICARALTDKISIQLGIGPICLKRLNNN